MPFPPRPVDATLHGVVDLAAGTALMTVLPRAFGMRRTRTARQMRATGAAHLAYSSMTDYPLGIVKAIPFKAHIAIDALGAVAVGALPFLTGQWREGRRQWVPHIALALFELSSLAITDPTGRGDYHGDVEAVRQANIEDPHRKIHSGPPAVRRPSPAPVAAGVTGQEQPLR
jgi:hypothetical protein